MPRVKFEYVVSFSSEDPENPASNLLASEISKKKWLCTKGEPSCSVVLQLTHAVQISTINIGVNQAALVEVLVGRSEQPNVPFEVVVPSCVFLSPTESRRQSAPAPAVVRSFSGAQLSAAAAQRWDRVKVVCSQPYNKHCKYGLSYVHIFEPEHSAPKVTAPASSEDEAELTFRPGELFASHRAAAVLQPTSSPSLTSTAQIRKTSLQAMKNITDASTKVVKSPIVKGNSSTPRNGAKTESTADRARESLVYTEEDDQPHAKIDRVVHKHNESKTNPKTNVGKQSGAPTKTNNMKNSDDESKKKDKPKLDRNNKNMNDSPSTKEPTRSDDNHGKRKREQMNKKNNDTRKRKTGRSARARDSSSLLAGVVFTLSGYQHPRRGAVRGAALALGARCVPDLTPDTTHLICAFPNTPKLRAARGMSTGGQSVQCVLAEWVEESSRLRRRLPEEWFATEPRHRVTPPEHALSDSDTRSDTSADTDTDTKTRPMPDSDTDDDIERVRQELKRRRTDATPPTYPPPPDASDVTDGRDAPDSSAPRDQSDTLNSDQSVLFVCDERYKANMTLSSDTEQSDADESTDGEGAGGGARGAVSQRAALPAVFAGRALAADVRCARAGFDVALLERYVRAHAGEFLQECEDADYVLSAEGESDGEEGGGGGVRVRADWVWSCVRAGRQVSTEPYRL